MVEKLLQARAILGERLSGSDLTPTSRVKAIKTALGEFVAMREEAHDTVKDKKVDALHNQILKLNQTQRDRKFLARGSKPIDQARCACPFCKHIRADEPDASGPLLTTNLLATSEHDWQEQVMHWLKRSLVLSRCSQ